MFCKLNFAIALIAVGVASNELERIRFTTNGVNQLIQYLNKRGENQPPLPMEDALELFGLSSLVELDIFLDSLDRQEWNLVTDRLFTPRGHLLKPMEVFEMLLRADELFEYLDVNVREGSEALRIGQIRSLIEVGESSWKKCELEDFRELSNKSKKPNTISDLKQLQCYTDYFSQMQYYHCKDKILSELTKNIGKIDYKTQENAKLLAEIMRENAILERRNYDKLYADDLNAALLSYLKAQPAFRDLNNLAWLLDPSRVGRQMFKKEFENLVVNMCKVVDAKLKPSYDVLAIVYNDNFVKKDLDDYTLNWVTSARVCSEILRRGKTLHDTIYKMLQEHYTMLVRVPEKNFFSRLIGRN